MRRNLPLTFIVLTVTLDAIGIGLMFPVLPDLIRELTGLDYQQAALWGGALTIVFAVMQFLCGPALGALSDRFGRRPVLLVSVATMGLNYVVMATTPSIWVLLAARAVGGMAAATQATATAFIADITPPERRGQAFGLIGAAFGVGFVLGPLIGGLLAGIDPRAPFWAAAGLCAVNLILGWRVLPESLSEHLRRPVRAAGLNPLTALAAAARLPAIRPTLVTFLILTIAMNVYPAVWAFFGHARFGWSTAMVGASLALYGISFAAGQVLLVGPLIRRFGEHRAAAFGMCVNLVTLTAMGLVTAGWAALVLTPLTALGGVTAPALQAIASRRTGPDAQGALQGVMSSLNAVAVIIAPGMMTGVFATVSPGAPFLLAAALMFLCLALHLASGPGQNPLASSSS
jgi:DHA1 family tetracycline resistance protein-like MFS transporter